MRVVTPAPGYDLLNTGSPGPTEQASQKHVPQEGQSAKDQMSPPLAGGIDVNAGNNWINNDLTRSAIPYK